MMNFYEFSWQNQSHREVSDRCIDILFISEEDGLVRQGHLFTDEVPIFYEGKEVDSEYHYMIKYKSHTKDFTMPAEGVYFTQIKLRDKYEDI